MYTRLTGSAFQVDRVRCARSASLALSEEVNATSPSTPAVVRPALSCVTRRTLTSVFDRLRSISFCRDRTLAQSPACVALKILCRSRRTLSSGTRQSAESQSRRSPSGPFTPRAAIAIANACPVIASNLPFGSGDRDRSSSKAHPVHVSTLSGPGTPSRIRPVIRDGRRRTRPSCPGFLPPFGSPAFASWTILFPPGTSASLTVGLPAAPTRPDPDGVPTFRWHETRPGRAPSIPRGRRCSHDRPSAPGRRLPLHSGQPLHPGTATHQPGLTLTRRHQGFTHVHPSGLPLTCGPRMEREPLGLNPELRTPPLPATHVRAETGLEHYPGLRHRHHRPPPTSPLATSDFVSHHLRGVLSAWADNHLAAIIIPGQSGTYRHLPGRVTGLLAESGLITCSSPPTTRRGNPAAFR